MNGLDYTFKSDQNGDIAYPMDVIVQLDDDTAFDIEIYSNETVGDLKKKLSLLSEIPIENQGLFHNGILLGNNVETMMDLGVLNNSILILTFVENITDTKQTAGEIKEEVSHRQSAFDEEFHPRMNGSSDNNVFSQDGLDTVDSKMPSVYSEIDFEEDMVVELAPRTLQHPHLMTEYARRPETSRGDSVNGIAYQRAPSHRTSVKQLNMNTSDISNQNDLKEERRFIEPPASYVPYQHDGLHDDRVNSMRLKTQKLSIAEACNYVPFEYLQCVNKNQSDHDSNNSSTKMKSEEMCLCVQMDENSIIDIEIPVNSTIEQMKKLIADLTGISPHEQKLVVNHLFVDNFKEDLRLLGLHDGSIIKMVSQQEFKQSKWIFPEPFTRDMVQERMHWRYAGLPPVLPTRDGIFLINWLQIRGLCSQWMKRLSFNVDWNERWRKIVHGELEMNPQMYFSLMLPPHLNKLVVNGWMLRIKNFNELYIVAAYHRKTDYSTPPVILNVQIKVEILERDERNWYVIRKHNQHCIFNHRLYRKYGTTWFTFGSIDWNKLSSKVPPLITVEILSATPTTTDLIEERLKWTWWGLLPQLCDKDDLFHVNWMSIAGDADWGDMWRKMVTADLFNDPQLCFNLMLPEEQFSSLVLIGWLYRNAESDELEFYGAYHPYTPSSYVAIFLTIRVRLSIPRNDESSYILFESVNHQCIVNHGVGGGYGILWFSFQNLDWSLFDSSITPRLTLQLL